MTTRRTGYAVDARVVVDQRGVLNGVEHYRLAAGPYKHRWLRATAVRLP
jgi:hypothetical protein